MPIDQSIVNRILQQNPEAPQTPAEVRRLAKNLFMPVAQRGSYGYGVTFVSTQVRLEANELPQSESCGEYSRGLLDLALASDMLSQTDKDEVFQIMTDAQPSLEKTKTCGHFRFHWTEISPDARDNVAEADIDATCRVLNDLFDKYAKELKEPQADVVDGERVIDVVVYFDGGLFGSTSSFSNQIFLNSRDVVRDPCRRQTTSAHELFHRVQYAYGYVTGTADRRWWVEALGSWSQKYAYSGQHDYVQRVNAGLNAPENKLLGRSYDACHFWKFFGEQLVAKKQYSKEFEAIKEFMEHYQKNGGNAKRACGDVVQPIYPRRPFDDFFSNWAAANYAKDFKGVPREYEYDDDEVTINNCGRNYGPYRHILPVGDEFIGALWKSAERSVRQYGTEYFRFRLGPTVKAATVRFEGIGDGEFSVGLVQLKNDDWRSANSSFITGVKEQKIDLAKADVNGLLVAVSGVSLGVGRYKLEIAPS